MCSGMVNPTSDTRRVTVTRTSQNLGRTNVFWNGEPPSDTRRVTVTRTSQNLWRTNVFWNGEPHY